MIRTLLIASVLTLPVLAACNQAVKAPTDTGVCYAVETPEGEPTFNVVARDQIQIEMCAARLEEMRLRFRGLGSTRQEVTGAYQCQFILSRKSDCRPKKMGGSQKQQADYAAHCWSTRKK